MFVKLLASATATSAVVLRGMSYDTTNNKVIMKNHGLSDGNTLYFEAGTDGTVQGGLTANTIYAVAAQDDQGFQLKAVDATLAATGDAIALTTATSGHTANTFTLTGVKAKITAAAAVDGTLTIEAATNADGTGTPTMDVTHAYVIYCHDRATTACAITTDGTAAAHAELADTKVVYPHAQVLASGTALTLNTAASGGGTQITWTNGGAQNVTGVNWAVQKTTTVKYALVTGSWDADNNKAKALHPFANNDVVFYKASTVNTGLTNNGVYTVKVANLNNSEFSLMGDHATTYANATPFTADSTDVTFTGTNGVGGTFTKISGHDTNSKISSGEADDDKWQMGGAHGIAADDQVIFYCSDKATAANCNFAPLVDGNSYKGKTVDGTKIILKGTTGDTAIDIATDADGTGDNKGWLLEKAVYTGTGATTDAVEVTVVSDNAGASAARGLAMFGSVVAMGAAFLMA